MLKLYVSFIFLFTFWSFSGILAQEIKVTGDYNYPPYSFLDKEGEPSGMDIEVLNELEQILDLQFDVYLTEWDSAIRYLKAGKAKAITGIIYSEERERRFDFTIPLHTTHYSIFARKDSKIRKIEDMKGKKIVMLPEDISITGFIKPMGLFENYTYVKSLPDAIMRIESGMYDYVLAPYSLGMHCIAETKCENVEVKGPAIMPSMYCLAVQKGNLELLSKLNKGIEELRATGKLKEIQDKWIKYQRDEKYLKRWMRYTLLIIAVLLLLLILIFIWWWSLKKQVRRKALEIRKSEEKYMHVFNSVRDALLLADLSGKIIDANDESMQMFGYSYDEICGLTLQEIIDADLFDDQGLYELMKTNSSLRVFYREYRCRNKQEHEFHINLKATLFQFQGERHVLAVIRDITEDKKSELALLEAKKEAEEANLARGNFISHVSHEVRTPLNAIIGFTYLLQSRTDVAENQEMYIRMIKNSGQTLLEIINEILDMSKIESGKVELDEHEFQLQEVLGTVDDILSIQCNEKGLELTFHNQTDKNLNYLGDSLKIKQVLINLCGNALKFTEQGIITVDVREINRDVKNRRVELYFSVTDTGIGLTDEQKAKIFLAYDQSDASITRKYGGTGLGLTICQSLVSIMGGKIEVESEPGTGSRFYFTLWLGYSKDEP